MKTIIENDSKLSKFILQDDVNVTLTEKTVEFDNIIVCDLNQLNATVIENVTPPEDWTGNKYTYENDEFILNPNWVDTKEFLEQQK
jgi:hypothetical protein